MISHVIDPFGSREHVVVTRSAVDDPDTSEIHRKRLYQIIQDALEHVVLEGVERVNDGS